MGMLKQWESYDEQGQVIDQEVPLTTQEVIHKLERELSMHKDTIDGLYRDTASARRATNRAEQLLVRERDENDKLRKEIRRLQVWIYGAVLVAGIFGTVLIWNFYML